MEPEKLLERASEPTWRRIEGDRDQVSPVLRPVFDLLQERAFDIDFDAGKVRQNFGGSLLESFSLELGRPFSRYLADLRLETATRLLSTGNLTVADAASLVGYDDVGTFRRAFKRWAGMTPQQVPSRGSTEWPSKGWDPIDERLLERLAEDKANRDEWAWVLGTLRSIYPAQETVSEGENQAAVLEQRLAAELGADLGQRTKSNGLRWLRNVRLVPAELLFEILREQSLVVGRRNRQRGVEIAELALAYVSNASALDERRLPCLLAVAWAVLGNAHRLADDPASAQTAFRSAHRELSSASVPDPLAEADVLNLEASLYLFQRRLPQAESHLDRAIALAQVFDGHRLYACALLQRVSLLIYQGELGSALGDLERAAVELEGLDDERLELGVHLNIAAICAWRKDADRGWEALRIARAKCHPENEPLIYFQLMSVEGMLLDASGELTRAGELLARSREGLAQRREMGQAAAVSLELAAVLYRQGKYQEATRLAAEAVPLFQSLEVEREAISAAKLLRQAIAARQVSGELLQDLRDLVRRLQSIPLPGCGLR